MTVLDVKVALGRQLASQRVSFVLNVAALKYAAELFLLHVAALKYAAELFLLHADPTTNLQCQLDALMAHERALQSELQALAAY